VGPGRIAGHFRSGRDATEDTSLGVNNGTFPDGYVIFNACLPCQHGATPNLAASGYANLGYDDAIRAYLHVVGDMHKVVNLSSRAYERGAGLGSIYGAVGSDFYVILDGNGADLGDLDALITHAHVPEAVGTHYHAGMEHNPIAQGAVRVYGHVGVKDAIFSYRAIVSDDGTRHKDRAVANLCSIANHHVWAYGHVFTDLRSLTQDGARVDAFGSIKGRGKHFKDLGEGVPRVIHTNEWFVGCGGVEEGDDRGCSGFLGFGEEAGVLRKYNVACLSVFDTGHADDHSILIAYDGTLHVARKFAYGAGAGTRWLYRIEW
jgi:hypothetical protein